MFIVLKNYLSYNFQGNNFHSSFPIIEFGGPTSNGDFASDDPAADGLGETVSATLVERVNVKVSAVGRRDGAHILIAAIEAVIFAITLQIGGDALIISATELIFLAGRAAILIAAVSAVFLAIALQVRLKALIISTTEFILLAGRAGFFVMAIGAVFFAIAL
jgi:hypothetical protein